MASTAAAAAAVDEVQFDFYNMVRIYKSGKFERMASVTSDNLPPGMDPATGVASKDVTIVPEHKVWARLYLPPLKEGEEKKKLPVVVYFHGGCFVIGSAGSPFHHNYLNSLAVAAGVVAVSVEYRLAPEHPIPAAYNDSWAAVQWAASLQDPWLKKHGDVGRLFLAGESAGANIAYEMGRRALAAGIKVKGEALVHLLFWSTERLPEERSEDKGRMLQPELLDSHWPSVCPGAKGFGDPRINPPPPPELLACERVLVAVGGRDLLFARGKKFYEEVKGSGGWKGEAELVVSEGEDHGFHFFSPDSDKAKHLMARLASFFNRP